jgi:hypothetical protein
VFGAGIPDVDVTVVDFLIESAPGDTRSTDATPRTVDVEISVDSSELAMFV